MWHNQQKWCHYPFHSLQAFETGAFSKSDGFETGAAEQGLSLKWVVGKGLSETTVRDTKDVGIRTGLIYQAPVYILAWLGYARWISDTPNLFWCELIIIHWEMPVARKRSPPFFATCLSPHYYWHAILSSNSYQRPGSLKPFTMRSMPIMNNITM